MEFVTAVCITEISSEFSCYLYDLCNDDDDADDDDDLKHTHAAVPLNRPQILLSCVECLYNCAVAAECSVLLDQMLCQSLAVLAE